ncbi:hypothetical protein BJ912DRAFT_991755 [Pholiota molesta]|nr:hypothetical protein BJ912DRAFT_991755 [Pholiota molesta]
MSFLDLPIEILPEVIEHVLKPQHLAQLCLVNKTFRAFATPRLYERIYIYSWHREGNPKLVIKLFDTLSRYVYLASYLRRLEIRDFPKAVTTVDNDILSLVLRGLKNCINLKSCIWTRDGSLNSEFLKALQCCENLRGLEFNGHNDGHYDARLLLGFTKLERILIIMPSPVVVSQIKPWLSITGPTLRSFTLICKASNIITDALLESIAPYLPNLEDFHLTGWVWSIVSATSNGLVGLGLEGVSPKFDMASFASHCISSGALIRLHSITLTVHQQLSIDEWTRDIYSIGASFEASATEALWKELILTHSERLIRISIHRMLISLDAIASICSKCINSKSYSFLVQDQLADCLSHAKKLRTVHINSPVEASADEFPFALKKDQVLSIIQRCDSTLTQFGCNSKVWQVDRRIIRDSDGTLRAQRILAPYGSPEVPEQFTVVRT